MIFYFLYKRSNAFSMSSTFVSLIHPTKDNMTSLIAALSPDEQKDIWDHIASKHAKKMVGMALAGKLTKDDEKWNEKIAIVVAASVADKPATKQENNVAQQSAKTSAQKHEWSDKASKPTTKKVSMPAVKKAVKKSVEPFSRKYLQEHAGIECSDDNSDNGCTCEIFVQNLINGKVVSRNQCRNGSCNFLHQLSSNGGLILRYYGYAFIDDEKYKVWYMRHTKCYVGCRYDELDVDGELIPQYINIPDDVEITPRE